MVCRTKSRRGEESVKAAVCRAFGAPLEIEEVHLSEPAKDELRVRLAACAICHSDIFFADGAWGGSLPAVYGHEASGVVDAVGPGVNDFRPGDHVVATLIRSCGHCHYCSRGVPVACETTFPLDENSPLTDSVGKSIEQGMGIGAFAEYIVVDSSQAVVIPNDLPLETASLIACSVLTGWGAVVNTAQVEAGDNVVVIGAGGVGLNTIQGARLSDAAEIIAIDLNKSKFEAALRFGATSVLDAGMPDLAAMVRKRTQGRGADYAFVTVGAKSAFDQSYDLIGPTGTVVLVGMPASGVMSEIDPGTMASKQQRILGSKMGSVTIERDIPRLASLYQQGKLELDSMVSGRYPLEQINAAMDSVRRGEALRNLVVF